MKRLTALISALLLVSGLCSCGQIEKSEKEDTSAKTSVSEEKEESETTTISEDEKSEASDNEAESDFIGKWELVKIINNGEELTEEMTGGIPLYALCRFEMKDDFTAVTKSGFFYNGEIADESTEWEWEMGDDSKAYFHNEYTQFSDVQTYAVIEDGFLVLCEGEDTGNKAYLEKVDEFHKLEDTEQNDDTEPTTVQTESTVDSASDISDFVGKWECFDLGGIKENLDVVPSEFFKFEIKEDGSSTLYLNYGKENEYGETYTLIKKEDGTFEMVADYDIFPAKIENGILKVEISETLFSFKKVSEFTVSES